MKKIISIGVAALLSIPSVAFSASIVATPKILKASPTDGTLIVLGASFDRINEEPLTERCIAATPSQLFEYQTNATGAEWLLSIVQGHEELHKFFSGSTSASANGSYGAFSGSGNYSSQVTKETHFEKDSYAIAGKFTRSFYQLNARPSGEFSDIKSSAQTTYNNNVAEFRNRCGDGYVSNVVMGVMAQFSLRIISVSGSSSVTKAQATDLQADIQNYGSGDASSTSKKTISTKYSSYSLDAVVATTGFDGKSSFMHTAMSVTQFLDLIDSLKNTDNYNPMPIKAYVNDYQFVMPDIYVAKKNYDNWISVAYETDARCSIFSGEAKQAILADKLLNNGLSIINSCAQATSLIDNKINECSDSTKFSLCQEPIASACQSGGIACSDIVNGELIPAWAVEDVHQRYAQKFNSGKTHVREFTVCLPGDTVFDVSRGDDGYYRTSNNRNDVHTHVNTSYRCDKTTFYVKRSGGIHFSSDIYLYGLKAQRTPILSTGF